MICIIVHYWDYKRDFKNLIPNYFPKLTPVMQIFTKKLDKEKPVATKNLIGSLLNI